MKKIFFFFLKTYICNIECTYAYYSLRILDYSLYVDIHICALNTRVSKDARAHTKHTLEFSRHKHKIKK